MAELGRVPKALTIAGSDSGGGAGIQADLKSFAAMGVYGSSVLTAITAQNTISVTAVHEIPTEMIASQVRAVLTDIGADAVKTGMLSSSAIIETVAEELDRFQVTRLVVDPVMVAKSGDSLLQEEAVDALRKRLLPMAEVVTPNIPEAEVLTGFSISTSDDVHRAAVGIVEMGARAVVVKGGHLEGPAVDTLYDGREFRELTAERINTRNTHGTGCTFAASIAAGLAKGMEVVDAVAAAKEYVTGAIRQSFQVGEGHGPLNHFYRWW